MRRNVSPGSLRHAVACGWALSALAAASCGGSTAIMAVVIGDGGSDAGIDQSSAATDGDLPDSPDPAGLAPGKACTAGDACASGFCVDGVCCETQCTQGCYSCNLAGGAGSCLPAEVGTDPRDECPDDGQLSCGRDGQCDGSGSCRHYPTGLICQPQSCSGSTRTNAFRCNGAGQCRPTSGQPCDPFLCDGGGTDCRDVCTSNSDCVAGNFCVGGSCGKKPLGAGCSRDDDCNSTMCQQGVCCNVSCTGTCLSCALPGATGTCTEVPAGEDPLDQCADAGRTSCSSDGSCDGRGACRLYLAGTVCRDPACAGSTGTAQGRCDGLGTCALGPGVTCGGCQACALTATAAICAPLAAGAAPRIAGQCANQGAASCGTDGTCDGAGACRLYVSGTVCMAGTCPTGPNLLAPQLCDGAGICQAPVSAVCPGGFLCNTASNLCKTTCAPATSATDCAAPNICAGIGCGTLEVQYQANGETSPTTVSPHPQFQVVNLGATTVSLSDLTLRYWYTADGAQGQSATFDYAINGGIPIQANLTAVFAPAPVPAAGADSFFQVGFTAAAGNLAANGGLAMVLSRFNSANFATTYTQTGDYSFDATKIGFTDWLHVTLYRRGVLVWGIEPR